jgi:hypothetical protein
VEVQLAPVHTATILLTSSQALQARPDVHQQNFGPAVLSCAQVNATTGASSTVLDWGGEDSWQDGQLLKVTEECVMYQPDGRILPCGASLNSSAPTNEVGNTEQKLPLGISHIGCSWTVGEHHTRLREQVLFKHKVLESDSACAAPTPIPYNG